MLDDVMQQIAMDHVELDLSDGSSRRVGPRCIKRIHPLRGGGSQCKGQFTRCLVSLTLCGRQTSV